MPTTLELKRGAIRVDLTARRGDHQLIRFDVNDVKRELERCLAVSVADR